MSYLDAPREDENNSGKVAMVHKHFAWHYIVYEQKISSRIKMIVEKMYSRLGGKQNFNGCIGGTGSADGRYVQFK